jgi:solute carrier family 25 carnitine/acylcarnitine transporter 20/29
MLRPSFVLIARRIYTRDGLSGLFRGLDPCFLRMFPVNASAIFVYEGL